MKPRTMIYVDGFNFYYGAVRGTLYKWLDLENGRGGFIHKPIEW